MCFFSFLFTFVVFKGHSSHFVENILDKGKNRCRETLINIDGAIELEHSMFCNHHNVIVNGCQTTGK